MGFPMAGHLLKKGPDSSSKFLVYDVSSESTQKFKSLHPEKQVTIASSPADVAAQADVIVSMLPAGQHVRQTYLGKKGILEGLAANNHIATCIDSSTIDVKTAQEVARALGNKGSLMVDAPVSGGTLGAESGKLTFMVGAPTQKEFDAVKPILQTMGQNIVYCGPNGLGLVAKICNNMLLGISMLAVSETMNLGIRSGMDPKLLAGILNTSTGRCWSSDTYNPVPGVMPNVPSSREYDGGFGIKLMRKDLGLAIDAAREANSTVVLGGLVEQVYNLVSQSKGFEKKDFSVVFKYLNEKMK